MTLIRTAACLNNKRRATGSQIKTRHANAAPGSTTLAKGPALGDGEGEVAAVGEDGPIRSVADDLRGHGGLSEDGNGRDDAGKLHGDDGR